LDQQPEVPERPDARPLERARGALEFRGVSFAYGPDRPVLHDVSCVIPPGTRLGVVGATGAGKTTLISLLTRFYDPQHGAILLDGTDLREYRLTDLRRQFAVVLQDSVLFSLSIAENIAYAAPGATREQVVAAAQAAKRRENLLAHPAVQAWRQLHPDRVVPDRITPAKFKPNKPRPNLTVYRLEGIGADGAAVIAKRCTREGGRIERIVYERVLPH